MEKLLNNGNNLLTVVKSTNAITAGSIIKAAKKQADKLLATTGHWCKGKRRHGHIKAGWLRHH